MAALITRAFPDVRRADAGTILVSSWTLPAPGVQKQAADLAIEKWEHQERPDAMLSFTTFLSENGREVLNYAQWTDDDSQREWTRAARRSHDIGGVERMVLGIERPGEVRYSLHRSYTSEEEADSAPGALVTPTFETEGPDSQRAFIDGVIAILERTRPPGLLAAHFHMSKDGHGVLNHAEWRDMSAWRRFAESGGTVEMGMLIEGLEGVAPAPTQLGVPRYLPYKSLVNVEAP
ncbi:antibiotic biosynthesis monooxygenase [Streptomyces venezuelae]|uniref:Antibiotic biosynthesis monooxygenase n=1 Tax=Streptomyces venezuelae TaxID=54571 RepID=A0A5P2C8A3_STRVZ|nr:antibiotic biosynthesis monooxygenase [Streptomyces venezuelae]QES38148.1 antibiotic biosynthesis monooxygenase [Streptomyces venezuelae]